MKLAEVCEVVRGSSPRPKSDPRFYGGSVPRLMVADLTRDGKIVAARIDSLTELGAKQSRPMLQGDVVIAVSGAPGLPAILAHDACIHDGFVGLRDLDKRRVDAEFLYAYLTFIRAASNSRAVGAIFKNLTTDQIKDIHIPDLPLAEQRRISAILDAAEALRAKRRAALAKLDTLTQSIFLDMFGDPTTNPKKWPASTVGEQLTFQLYGPRFYNEKYTEDGVRIVRITDLDAQGNLDFDQMPRLAVVKEDLEKYALRPGDIIFARTGATVGKVALIAEHDPICIAGAYFITMRFADAVDPCYARGVLTCPSIQEVVWVRSKQSAQQNFSGPGLRSLPMPLPPSKMQKEFARRVAAIDRHKGALRAALAKLEVLFASLQHRAFRGEL